MTRPWLHSACALLCLVSGLQSRPSRASETLNLGVLPFSLGAPGYPNSFTGLGMVAAAYYFWDNLRLGAGVDFQSQGSGYLVALNARYYFKGYPQFGNQGQDASLPLEVSLRTWGMFIEGGPMLYQVSQLGPILPTASSPLSTFGSGMTVSLGLEYPLFWGIFMGLKLTYADSLGGELSTATSEITLGYPFRF